MEKKYAKTQKRTYKPNKLKSMDIDKQMFLKFIVGLQTFSLIYNYYDKYPKVSINKIKKYIGKVCSVKDTEEYFVPIHIIKNQDLKCVIGGFFYENDIIVECEIVVNSLNEINITNYDIAYYLMEGLLI